MKLTSSEQMKINASTGSSTRQPVSQISDEKANNGFMHVFQGHFTKMTEEVTKDIRAFSDSSEWPTRMRTCKEDLDSTRIEVDIDLPLDVVGELGTLKRKLTATNTNITKNKKKLKALKDDTENPDQEPDEVVEKIKENPDQEPDEVVEKIKELEEVAEEI